MSAKEQIHPNNVDNVRKLRVSRSHLLNRMTDDEKPIHALHNVVSKGSGAS